MIKLFLIIVLLCSPYGLARQKTITHKSNNSSEISEVDQEVIQKVIQDGWYTMQTGSTPWGYYHEVIERNDKNFSYRYEMVKKEQNQLFQEDYGALSELDLTPKAFNLKKSSPVGTEIIDGNYSFPVMNVHVEGAQKNKYKRQVPKGTIFESFFPLWVHLHWDELNPGKTHTLKLFSENRDGNGFYPQNATVKALKMDTSRNCKILNVTFQSEDYLWCINEKGILLEMKVEAKKILIKKVKNEKEAKSIL